MVHCMYTTLHGTVFFEILLSHIVNSASDRCFADSPPFFCFLSFFSFFSLAPFSLFFFMSSPYHQTSSFEHHCEGWQERPQSQGPPPRALFVHGVGNQYRVAQMAQGGVVLGLSSMKRMNMAMGR